MKNASFQPFAHGFFSDRDDLQDAMAYAVSLLSALPAKHRMAAFTALYVVVNTAAKMERKTIERGRKASPSISVVEDWDGALKDWDIGDFDESLTERTDSLTIYKVQA